MFCRKCGAKNNENARFCNLCHEPFISQIFDNELDREKQPKDQKSLQISKSNSGAGLKKSNTTYLEIYVLIMGLVLAAGSRFIFNWSTSKIFGTTPSLLELGSNFIQLQAIFSIILSALVVGLFSGYVLLKDGQRFGMMISLISVILPTGNPVLFSILLKDGQIDGFINSTSLIFQAGNFELLRIGFLKYALIALVFGYLGASIAGKFGNKSLHDNGKLKSTTPVLKALAIFSGIIIVVYSLRPIAKGMSIASKPGAGHITEAIFYFAFILIFILWLIGGFFVGIFISWIVKEDIQRWSIIATISAVIVAGGYFTILYGSGIALWIIGLSIFGVIPVLAGSKGAKFVEWQRRRKSKADRSVNINV